MWLKVIAQIKKRIGFIPHFVEGDWQLSSIERKEPTKYMIKLNQRNNSGVVTTLVYEADVSLELGTLSEVFSGMPIEYISFRDEKPHTVTFIEG